MKGWGGRAGDQNEGGRLVLYLPRKAATIKTPYQVLADKALTQVVQTALGLSPNVSAADIDKQAALLSKLVDFSDFQDPAKVSHFAQRFAAMWDASQASSNASSNPSLILLGQSTPAGMDSDLLTKLQMLRLGR